jgi:hypothetical protein
MPVELQYSLSFQATTLSNPRIGDILGPDYLVVLGICLVPVLVLVLVATDQDPNLVWDAMG